MTHYKTYPFTAIVGQQEMKLALIINAIFPSIGGVLIRGEKGTAKSTAARSLADLLPEIESIADCPFNCNPKNLKECCHPCQHRIEDGFITQDQIVSKKMRVINLPINAGEDRVVGTIDIKKALQEGIRALEPGILAEANRNILYIDEVNLLSDNVADTLLDAAAMGINMIEREGVSLHHPASFILIGTMNPEEGNLRPQLLDRFGLSVKVKGLKDINDRIKIMQYSEQYRDDPYDFHEQFEDEQEKLGKKIENARKIVQLVKIDSSLLRKISLICIALGIESHRADITILRASKSLAAFEGRLNIEKNDIKIAAKMALEHRIKKLPFEDKELDVNIIDEILESEEKDIEQMAHEEKTPEDGEYVSSEQQEIEQETDGKNDIISDNTKKNADLDKKDDHDPIIFEIKNGMQPIHPNRKKSSRIESPSNGKRINHPTKDISGRSINTVKYDKLKTSNINDIAFNSTINCAILDDENFQALKNGKKITIKDEHIHLNRRNGKASYLMVFCVDASGSMGVQKRMEQVKGVVFSVLQTNYIYRDKVSLITFRNERADVILPPTRSVELAQKMLSEIPTGGSTPLFQGLIKSIEIIQHELDAKTGYAPIIILITDGRTNVDESVTIDDIEKASKHIGKMGIELIVIDTEDVDFKIGVSQMIAESIGGKYYHIETLDSEYIQNILNIENLVE